MTTNQKYAVLFESAAKMSLNKETRYQVAVIEGSGSNVAVLHRTTNGGRGSSNSWIPVASLDALEKDIAFDNEPMAISISPAQAEVAEHLAIRSSATLPTNSLSALNRQKRILAPTPHTLGSLITDFEVARIERLTFETWIRGEQEAEPSKAQEVKPKVIWNAGTAFSGEYELPAQNDQLVAWATLSVPDTTAPEYLRYVERTIAGKTLTEWFDHASRGRKAVVINGPAGSGKTTAAYYYAGKLGVPLTIVECNTQMDNSVIQGKYVPTGNGNELTWRYSALATAVTQEGVILLNEVSRMTPKANALFMKLLAEKELIIDTHHNETLKLHPKCLIIADANPNYRGTMNPDEAFLDRFLVKLEFDYDTEIEKQFIPCESLLELAGELRRAANVEGKFSVPISTRLLLSFVDVALDLGFEPAVYNFVNAFPAPEREALRMLFSTYEENITDDLALVELEVTN